MIVDGKNEIVAFRRLLKNVTEFEAEYFMLRFNKFSKFVTILHPSETEGCQEFNINRPDLVAERIEIGY